MMLSAEVSIWPLITLRLNSKSVLGLQDLAWADSGNRFSDPWVHAHSPLGILAFSLCHSVMANLSFLPFVRVCVLFFYLIPRVFKIHFIFYNKHLSMKYIRKMHISLIAQTSELARKLFWSEYTNAPIIKYWNRISQATQKHPVFLDTFCHYYLPWINGYPKF